MATVDEGGSLSRGDLVEEDSGHRGSQSPVYEMTVDKVLLLQEPQLAYLLKTLD